MPLKKCRYNNKHKFETDEQLLSHEKYCPDKSKRTDLKVCPYDPKHIVLTKQYEKHIKTCKHRPKNEPKKEDSILQAYIQLIREAKHYIYIENQFFVSKPFDEEDRKTCKKKKAFI